MKDDDPFYCGTWSGIHMYALDAESRRDMVPKFTREQCDRALRIDGLQKSVERAIKSRLKAIARCNA